MKVTVQDLKRSAKNEAATATQQLLCEFEAELWRMREEHRRIHPCTLCDEYFKKILG